MQVSVAVPVQITKDAASCFIHECTAAAALHHSPASRGKLINHRFVSREAHGALWLLFTVTGEKSDSTKFLYLNS